MLKKVIKNLKVLALLIVGMATLSSCIPQVAAFNNPLADSAFAVGQYTGNWEMTSPRTEQSTGTLSINQARNGSLFGVLTDNVTNRTPIQLICNPVQNSQLSCFLTSTNTPTSLTLSGNVGQRGFSGLWQAIDPEGEKNGIFNFQRVIQ